MTVPCEGQLLLMTPPFDGLIPEPIVLGTMSSCSGLFDEHGKQVRSSKASQALVQYVGDSQLVTCITMSCTVMTTALQVHRWLQQT